MSAASALPPGGIDRLRRASRIATILSVISAVIVIGALLIASYQLSAIEARQHQAAAELGKSRIELETTRGQLSEARASLSQAQCALRKSRSAIEAFHQRDYDLAIQSYDRALRCDPKNAYLLNLKAYSLFKAGRIEGAIQAQEESLLQDPKYAWGYFDLARFLCAAKSYDKAAGARTTALQLRPELAEVMNNDGEFMRLCTPELRVAN